VTYDQAAMTMNAENLRWTSPERCNRASVIATTSKQPHRKGVLNMVRSIVTILLVVLGAELFSPASNVAGPVFSQSKSVAPAQARKRALLVGVSDYCRDSTRLQCNGVTGKYWWDLHSAPDVEAIEHVLTERFGFRPDEIKALKTKDETKHSNIIDTFKTFLIEQTQPGDIVYFHFSGHGGQVPDDNAHGPNPKVGDELDGLDESLIPSDYVTRDDGSNNIRDDEIEQLLTSLSGRHVTITVDSCFSGTITRGGRGLTRGLMFRGPNVRNRNGLKDSASGLFADGVQLPTDVVVISAARNDQSAGETVDPQTLKAMGAFSYALVRALAAARSETTYRDIFEKINEEVSREQFGQDPQLEGSRDNILFSGIARPPQPYINVGLDGSKVMLKAGSLQAITKGSRFSIYRGGAGPKSDSPISQGEVVAIGPTSSVLKLTPAPDDKTLEALRTARAFETYHNFGDVRLKVLVDDNVRSMLGEKRLRELETLDLMNLAGGIDDWNVRVCHGPCPDEKRLVGENSVTLTEGLTMIRQDGSIMARIANGPKLLDEIKQAFEGEARWRLLKSLEHEDADLRIKMRLVPVTKIVQDPNTKLASAATDLAAEVEPQDGGQLVLHDGDTVMLEVMNLGTVAAFVSVLDLRSDGQIAPLFPHPRIPVGENENRFEIKKNSLGKPVWHRIPCPFVIKITEPYGPEVFKAIITQGPTDFSPLFRRTDAEDILYRRPRGTSRGQQEAKSPLGQLLLTAVTGRTRLREPDGSRGDIFGIEDAANLGVPVEKWSTAEITFEARARRTTK